MVKFPWLRSHSGSKLEWAPSCSHLGFAKLRRIKRYLFARWYDSSLKELVIYQCILFLCLGVFVLLLKFGGPSSYRGRSLSKEDAQFLVLGNIGLNLLVLAINSCFIWRALKQRRADAESWSRKCPKCGYSHSGLPFDSKCPECGFESRAAARQRQLDQPIELAEKSGADHSRPG